MSIAILIYYIMSFATDPELIRKPIQQLNQTSGIRNSHGEIHWHRCSTEWIVKLLCERCGHDSEPNGPQEK
jgi:hypothetical protein